MTTNRLLRSNSDSDRNNFAEILNLIENKFDANLKQFNNKIDKLSGVLRSDFADSIKQFSVAVDEKIQHLDNKICEISKNIDSKFNHVDESNKLHEIIIKGLPFNNNENLIDIFNSICVAIGLDANNVLLNNIFRLSRNSSGAILLLQFLFHCWKKKNL